MFSTSFFSSEVYHRQSLAQRGWQTALGRFVEGQRINSCLRVSQTTKLELCAHILNSSLVSEDTVVSQARLGPEGSLEWPVPAILGACGPISQAAEHRDLNACIPCPFTESNNNIHSFIHQI